jgi:iron complex outermembrane receptor protein
MEGGAQRRRSALWGALAGLWLVGVAANGWAQDARPAQAVGSGTTKRTGTELKKLSLEELMNVEVREEATLTRTADRLIPATLTTLDADAIQKSGARDLNELLDISTTDGQVILHHSHVDHFGMRGIISDREDKYLLRVNGQVMNQRMYVGVDAERSLPLLGDLRKVSVVYGPGSATYGAGALAGVINLETYNGLTFKGADLTVRQGFLDEMTTGEVRFGHQFDENSGLFIYYGVADRNGADSDYVVGRSIPARGIVAGEPVPYPVSHLGAQAYGHLEQKAHVSYVNGPFEIWARFTEGGMKLRPQRSTLQTTALPLDDNLGFTSYDRQYTLVATCNQDLSETFNLDAQLSYNNNLNIYDRHPPMLERSENEIHGRVIGNWKPNDQHAVALGIEYAHDMFNGATANNSPPPTDNWATDTFSVMAEHQWTLSDQWTTFVSARMDKHTYSEYLFSPRVAVVFTPTKEDTFKLIAANAVRRGGDAELRRIYTTTGVIAESEKLASLELRYERQHDEHWRFGIGSYVEAYSAIGIVQAATVASSNTAGEFLILGVEPEVSWTNSQTRVTLSHSFTRLLDARKATPGQSISAMPYGYGNSMASWADNVSKLTVTHDFTAQWSASSSLRVYWGFPGAADLAAWNGSLAAPYDMALTDPGYTKAFGPSLFWNVGVQYQPNKHLTLRADTYNMIGWIDGALGKRNYIVRGSEYSVQAPAVVLSARWMF